MKKLLLLLTLVTSLIALPSIAGAKDKDKDKDRDNDRDKKEWKVMRDDVRELNEQYKRLRETVNVDGASRRVRDDTAAIGGGVDRVNNQFDHGNFDYRDLHNRISDLMNAISRTRDQISYDNHRPRGYYVIPR